ncbi:hypothetical protein IWW55_000587 [Coemansia sp. RSA 2706]|nr:hypothetical protein IWW55_000587 [Coemansia sp. RSA 2706]KAJ2312430.1 hypothetical protein IWW54_002094 [Coemansia sp. RSA 2705]KAJ2319655.1 hypothetical protein IWW52_001841 [Coemansia sp. RSA 2704]
MGKLLAAVLLCSAALVLHKLCRNKHKKNPRTDDSSGGSSVRMDGRRTDETWQLVNTWRAQQQRLETRMPAQHSARTPGHTPESLSDRVARLEARAAAQAATISHLTHELQDAYGVQSNLWFLY